MMTQRAKLRRLAFIDFPSWSRGSRPLSPWTYPWVATRESPGRPYCNLGAGRLDAKGTMPDYLTHPGRIPAQKVMLKAAFSEVVKTVSGIMTQAPVLFAVCERLWRLRTPPSGRRRLDADTPLADAHQRTGQC